MKSGKVLPVALLTVLAVILVMLVGSRWAEKKTWTGTESGTVISSLDSGTSRPQVDGGGAEVPASLATPTPPPTPTPTPALTAPDVDLGSWELMLVNADNSIGRYTPPQVDLIGGTAQYFDVRALPALEEFLQAARDAGYTPYINAAYRPYATQEYLFNGRASQIAWGGTYTYEQAVEMAKKYVASPGTSEHQTGLCCDITDKYYSSYDAAQMDQGLLEWLKDNCAQYGFILRYPSNKVSVTGWDEPWHFRYVGWRPPNS